MAGFSLRTLLLTVFGCGILCGLFTTRGWPVEVAHLLLVLAFAVPGGSLAYDLRKTSRSVAIGSCIAAVIGTGLLSAVVLIAELWSLTA